MLTISGRGILLQDYPLILDTAQSGVQQTVTGFFCGDSGEKRLCITLMHQNEPYTPQPGTAALCGKKPDGTRFLHPCTVSGSQIYYLPTAQTLATPGTVQCQLILYGDDGSVLYAPRFALEVDPPLQPNEGLVSADEWSLLPVPLLHLLSRAENGTLLFQGTLIGALPTAETFAALPQGVAGMTAYVRTGDGTHPFGFYRFGTQWEFLPTTDHTHANQSVLDTVTADLVSHDHTHSNKSVLDTVTADTVSNAHTHANKADLDTLRIADGFLYCGDNAVGRVVTVSQFSSLPSAYPSNIPAYVTGEQALYRSVPNGWVKIYDGTHDHTHANKALLDDFTAQDGVLRHDGRTVVTQETDTLVPLSLGTTYAALQIRPDWYDVPVYLLGNNEPVASLVSDTVINGYAESEIRLRYVTDYVTRMPIPTLRVNVGGAIYTNYSALYHDLRGDFAAGWYDENDDPCDAPTLTNLSFDKLIVGIGEDITDLTDLSGEALCALQTLSRMVNVSTAAMGTLGLAENGVQRLTNAPVAGRTYYYETANSFSLPLPTISWMHDDLDLAIYLVCSSDIDVTFPAGTRFIGGAPNTDTGTHKLIAFCPKDENTWAVGGLDVEAAS